MSNLTTILKSKNKFKALSKGFKEAKAFIIYGSSEIKDESSSSEDEDFGGKNVNVFFGDSEQGKQRKLILFPAGLRLIKMSYVSHPV